MSTASSPEQPRLSRLKLYLALSRTPHGILDMATPCLSALLWLGGLPPPNVIGLGLLTAFSGYTAVYALNDVVDNKVDREKIAKGFIREEGADLDTTYVRHPIARGMLSLREAVFWTVAWAVLAIAGAYLLNPVCALIFIVGVLMEVLYCLLFKVSHFRTLVSGAVKTTGAVAAIFAVNPEPEPAFLLVVFLWLFIWEVGGQNIPNDLVDLEEDIRMGARTFPAGALLSGLFFLVIPASSLRMSNTPSKASMLFNRASYYPLAMLITTIISLVL